MEDTERLYPSINTVPTNYAASVENVNKFKNITELKNPIVIG